MRSTRRWTRCPAHLAALPRLDRRGAAPHRARHRPRSRGDPPDLLLLGGGARPVRRLRERPAAPAPRRSICTRCRAASSPTSRSRRARSGLETRWHEVAQAYRDANDLFGDIVKVTPSSKVVGDMALMMVAQDLTADDVLDPEHGHRLPGLGGGDAARRSRPAAGRLAEGAAGEGAEGRKPDHRPARLAAAAPPISTPAQKEAEKQDRPRRSTATSSPPT